MKQIVLEIEDSAYEQFMGMVGLCPSVKVVCRKVMGLLKVHSGSIIVISKKMETSRLRSR